MNKFTAYVFKLRYAEVANIGLCGVSIDDLNLFDGELYDEQVEELGTLEFESGILDEEGLTFLRDELDFDSFDKAIADQYGADTGDGSIDSSA